MRLFWIRFANYFLVLVFLSYYGSITLFYHTHHVENGILVVHSHPYESSNDKEQHHHSQDEYCLIHYLSSFFSTGIPALNASFHLELPFHKILFGIELFFHFPSFFTGANGLRGPPIR